MKDFLRRNAPMIGTIAMTMVIIVAVSVGVPRLMAARSETDRLTALDRQVRFTQGASADGTEWKAVTLDGGTHWYAYRGYLSRIDVGDVEIVGDLAKVHPRAYAFLRLSELVERGGKADPNDPRVAEFLRGAGFAVERKPVCSRACHG